MQQVAADSTPVGEFVHGDNKAGRLCECGKAIYERPATGYRKSYVRENPSCTCQILPMLNPAGSPTDGGCTVNLDSSILTAFAVLGTAVSLAVLNIAAARVKAETTLHDLRVRVAQLRRERLEKLRQFASVIRDK
jgi:hypothetical protein